MFFSFGGAIDMQVLTDLKRCFLRVCSRGTGPRATGSEGVLFAMRRSGSGDPKLQSPAPIILLIVIILQILLISGACERSRGPVPRATGPEGVLGGKKNSASKENSNVIY